MINGPVKKNSCKCDGACYRLLPDMHSASVSPAVSTDEAVYVNLNYYGALADMRIVKGVSLNGETSFTDYGNYSKVYNMSTYDEPKIASGAVS